MIKDIKELSFEYRHLKYPPLENSFPLIGQSHKTNIIIRKKYNLHLASFNGNIE